MKNNLRQEKSILRFTFNPGLALTAFRTTRPLEFKKKKGKFKALQIPTK